MRLTRKCLGAQAFVQTMTTTTTKSRSKTRTRLNHRKNNSKKKHTSTKSYLKQKRTEIHSNHNYTLKMRKSKSYRKIFGFPFHANIEGSNIQWTKSPGKKIISYMQMQIIKSFFLFNVQCFVFFSFLFRCSLLFILPIDSNAIM